MQWTAWASGSNWELVCVGHGNADLAIPLLLTFRPKAPKASTFLKKCWSSRSALDGEYALCTYLCTWCSPHVSLNFLVLLFVQRSIRQGHGSEECCILPGDLTFPLGGLTVESYVSPQGCFDGAGSRAVVEACAGPLLY